MRSRGAPAVLAVGAVLSLAPLTARATSPQRVHCPLQASAATGTVQWAFTQNGTGTYTHGRGTWSRGRAGGTICASANQPSGTSRNVVLAVAGRAALHAQVRRLGRLGVELVLPVSVAASDDAGCQAGARGSVTLFASYYETHHDSVRLRFGAGCTGHDRTYAGGQLHVLIGRNGRQVNGP